MKKTN
ncbi:hypothetical protein BN1723_009780 [Verticillium longisporum]